MPTLIETDVPRWAVTWALSIAVIVAAKLVIARDHDATRPAWWLWPGMAPERFHSPTTRPPTQRELASTLAYLATGIVILWLVVPQLPASRGTAWLGLLGLGLVLHFGLARLLSIHWRRQGFDAQPLFDRPLAARSLGEFWGRRWNRAFSDVSRRWIYRPLRSRWGPRGAGVAVFAASGVGHDVLLSLPAGGGFGRCTAYFAIQAVGLLLERRWRSRLGTLAVVVLPLPLLFHGPFLDGVVLPFLAAIGASPE